VKILVDAQLPPALARWLREAGHEAQPVREVGLREAEDETICEHALRVGAVVVTKDEDFAALAKGAGAAPVVVWLRIGNCSNEALRAWLEPRLPGIVELVAQGGRVVEVI
jgi:predicted nuclease of predicted toxin-antitoxin system